MKTRFLKLLLFVCLLLAASHCFAQCTVALQNNTSSTIGGINLGWCTSSSVGTSAVNVSKYVSGAVVAAHSVNYYDVCDAGQGYPANTNLYFGFNPQNNPTTMGQVQEVTTGAGGVSSGGQTIVFEADGSTPPCLTNLTFSVVNNTAQPQTYFAADKTSISSAGYYQSTTEGSPTVCNPGQTDVIIVSAIACSTAGNWIVISATGYQPTPTSDGGYPPSGLPLANQPIPTGSDGYGPAGNTSAPTSQGPQLNLPDGSGQYNPTNPAVAGTNSPILFSSSPTNGTGTIIAQGDAALYTAVVNGFNQNHVDETAIQTAVVTNQAALLSATGRGDSNIVNAVNNLTNGLATINTNLTAGWVVSSNNMYTLNTNLNALGTNVYRGLTNVVAAINNLTNFLGGTNSASTNGDAATMEAELPTTSTNAANAIAAAISAEGNSGFDAFSNSMTPNIPADANGSGAPDMTITFAGVTVDLNPITRFPGVATFLYEGFKSLLILFFVIDVSRMYWELVKAKGATQQGRVPDLEVNSGGSIAGFGFQGGGNWIGLITFFLLPAAFIALFTGAMSYVFSNIGISIASAMNLTSFQTNIGSGAWYLLSSVFPVYTFFSLLCSRIVLQFSLAHIYSVASDAARWLLG